MMRTAQVVTLLLLATTLAAGASGAQSRSELEALWQVPVTGQIPGHPLLADVTMDGVKDIILSDASTRVMRLQALDGVGGDVLWSLNLKSSAAKEPLVIPTGHIPLLVVNGGARGPVAIDGRSGQVVWSTDSFIASQYSSGDAIAVGVLSDVDGDRVGEIVVAWQAYFGEDRACTLIGTTSAALLVLSGSNGRMLSRTVLPETDSRSTFAWFKDEPHVAYRMTSSCQFERLPRLERWKWHADVRQFEREWVRPAAAPPGAFASDGERIYVSDSRGALRALAATTGTELWKRQLCQGKVASTLLVETQGQRSFLLAALGDLETNLTRIFLFEGKTGQLLQERILTGVPLWGSRVHVARTLQDDTVFLSLADVRNRYRLPDRSRLYVISKQGLDIRAVHHGAVSVGAVIDDIDNDGFADVIWPTADGVSRFRLDVPLRDTFVFQ